MKTLIQNGLLVDPANRVQAKLNLLLDGGKVAAVTADVPAADRVIDAAGRVVCPGFVDIHIHEDPIGPDGRVQRSIFDAMLRMGVTTVAGGNCGINTYDPVKYLDIVERDGAPVNVALYAGHTYLREQCGAADKYRAIKPEQQSELLRRIDAALDAGCVGVSFGLRYVPGMGREEFWAAAERCSGRGALIAAHIRDDAAYVFDAVDEFAQAGVHCGVPVQISHIGSMGGFGQMERVLRMVDEYRANGLDIACDCYPYFAFSTRIGETTYDDGWLERYHCDYSACMLAEGKYKGRRCTKDIFEEMRRDFPQCITVCYVMREDDIRMALAHPNVMVASDGLINSGQGHPRAAGCFPRFLREFVLDGDIGLYRGIEKMTAFPAARLGLRNKGRLNVGADADITIFDPGTVRDGATFEDPMIAPRGIDYVFIGGELAAKDCGIVNPALGTALRAR